VKPVRHQFPLEQAVHPGFELGVQENRIVF
jgi:hypothetical protein